MTYAREFYEDEGRVARESAAVVLPWLFERFLTIQTVIDVGCGTGEWARQAATLGATAWGVDLGVPEDLRPERYIDHDLSHGYPARVDLAICLEVAEHLPDTAAVPLVEGLAHARIVLFSAATPGQPGVGHVNCQPHDYWHGLFAHHNLYPEFVGDQFSEPVADFYRRNLYLYQ